jgi:glycosyltransferase involved in cell wall biosynthesis
VAPAERERLVLVEQHAQHVGGHWHATLLRLARAARRQGAPVTVAALHGMPGEVRGELRRLGVWVLTRPRGADVVGWGLQACAAACTAACGVTSRVWRRRAFPYQFTLLARCLTEAASLRAANPPPGPDSSRAAGPAGPASTAVVLTASEGLHALPALLSGCSHVRIVHDVYTTPGRVLRWAEQSALRHAPPVVVVATTRSIAADLRAVFPWLTPTLWPFAVIDPQDRVGDAERSAARVRHGVPGAVPVACLIGGWWPHKDVGTVERALRVIRRPITVIVAGAPLDDHLLRRMRSAPMANVIVHDRALSEAQLRDVYAAADLAIVSRYPSVTRECGIIADALQYGVSLICSDHDPAVSAALSAADWAAVFPARDAAALAATLDRVADEPLARPGIDESGRLGFRTAADAVDGLRELARQLAGSA